MTKNDGRSLVNKTSQKFIYFYEKSYWPPGVSRFEINWSAGKIRPPWGSGVLIHRLQLSSSFSKFHFICDKVEKLPTVVDKVRMYEEMMTNDDNVESSLLTSSLLKIHCLYKFCYKLHILSWRSRWTELCSSYIYEVCCTSAECVGDLLLFILLLLLFYSLSQFTRKYNG